MRARQIVLVSVIGLTPLATLSIAADGLPASYDRCLVEERAEAAIKACTEALDTPGLAPDRRADVLTSMGRQQRRNEQPNAALDSLAQAAALAPERGSIQAELAVAHHMAGDMAAAGAAHARAFDLGPATLSMFNNRGATRLAAGDAAGAVADFDAAMAAMLPDGPEAGDLFNNRANARCATGDVQGSFADRIQALYAKRFTAAAAQKGLKSTGFYNGPADGIWAGRSEDALRAWTAAGCPDAPATTLL